MRGVAQQLSYAQAQAALSWLVLAGCDELVDDAPRNWLEEPVTAPVRAAPIAPPRTLAAAPATVNPADAIAAAADSLEALTAALTEFPHPLRRPGVTPRLIEGSPATGALFVTDLPEAEGSATGERLLKMMASVGYSPHNARLLHLVPWPTVGSRPVTPAEVAAFAPFIARAIVLAPPRAVFAMGAAAATLSGSSAGIASARGKWTSVAATNIPLLATFHPRALGDQAEWRKLAFADLKMFKAKLDPEATA